MPSGRSRAARDQAGLLAECSAHGYVCPLAMTFDGFIQVAGVIDRAEADLLVDCGVRCLGFPLRLAVHREDLAEHEAAVIIAGLPAGVDAVLITYLDRAEEIDGFRRKIGTSIVQLHGDITRNELEHLRTLAPDLTIIKSLVVRDGEATALEHVVRSLAPCVDAFITDTYDPATGASGATGKTHDWAISRRMVEMSPRPVILAGGLTPGNVGDAVRKVQPAGIDVHTGVEGSDGRKDPALVRAFLAAARAALTAPVR